MKRKNRLAAIVLILASLLLFAGCSLIPARSGSDSNYPYDIAASEGYKGSEGEWLSEQFAPDTVYRRMYEEALADGSFTGTYFEFLKEIAPKADDTPYIQRALLSAVSIVCHFSESTTANGSAGAGVIIDLDKTAGAAYILTNYHVVYSSAHGRAFTDIGVYLYGGEIDAGKIQATLYGGIPTEDLAVLRVQNSTILKESEARAVDFGDSDALIAGERIYAIGNPENEHISVNEGVVSMELEYCRLTAVNGVGNIELPEIRIDAPVNEGNSGGGLFNAAGQFVGVVNARSNKDGVTCFGYAIPGNYALACARNILAGGGQAKVANPKIDYEVGASKAVYDEVRGITHIEEKLVVSIYFSGVGAVAGLRTGDTLVSGTIVRGGEEVETVYFTRTVRYKAFLYDIRKGDTVKLTVSRNGDPKEITISFALESTFETK